MPKRKFSAKQLAAQRKFTAMVRARAGKKRKGGKTTMPKKKSTSPFKFSLGGIKTHTDKMAKGMGYVDLLVMAGNAIIPQQTAQLNTPVVRTLVAYSQGNMQGAAAEAYRSGLLEGVTGTGAQSTMPAY
jgi:hypothetical protein